MKRLLSVLMLLPMFAAANAQAIHVGAEGSRYTGDGTYPYWQAAVTGSYTMHLYENLSFDANASLYYQYYDDDWLYTPYPDWVPPAGSGSPTQTFGGSIGLNGIIHVAGPISVFTGPRVMCNFVQKNFDLHRANMQWRVGLSADVWRLRIRASWDPVVTRRDSGDDDKGYGICLSVAWRL